MSSRAPISQAAARRRLRALQARLPPSGGSQPVRPPPRPYQPPQRALADLEALNAAGWVGAEPKHLVALYAWLHERVYAVPPEDLTRDPLAWLGAVSAATKLLREEFGGEPVRAVAWVRWVWVREKRTEDRKRAGGDESTFRIGWRYMFCKRSLVVDYRRALAQAKERGR